MTDRPPPTLGAFVPEPGDEELVALGCRRTTFEWVLRESALARAGVRLLSDCSVVGLSATSETPPRVEAVRYRRAGEEKLLRADLVVDASGRTSRAVEWLAAIGARAPREKLEPSGIVYYTRFYRFRPGASEPSPTEHPTAADFNWVKYAVFPADDRTFSVTLAVPLAFPRLKVLAKAEAFDAMVSSLPAVAPWIAPDVAEPIGDPDRPVQAMGGLINRLRRFMVRGDPVALGLFVLGDAAYCTNPLYGRGCAQAFLHADLLGKALDESAGDLRHAAFRLDRLAVAQIEPFYRASVLADRDAVRRAEGRKPRRLAGRLRQKFFEDGIAPATRCDPVVFRAFLRMFNMLDTPEQAFGRPEILLRSLRILLRGRRYNRRYALPDPPDREAVTVRCEAAVRASRTVAPIAFETT
jgi:2-polyprenyl-6-methoxyphenol hydroxylase-like FAD-dependent oxidoreductase